MFNKSSFKKEVKTVKNMYRNDKKRLQIYLKEADSKTSLQVYFKIKLMTQRRRKASTKIVLKTWPQKNPKVQNLLLLNTK
jgi:hypothetical protein